MSIFRNTVWFLKGMREYTASGYNAASASFNSKDLDVNCEVDLHTHAYHRVSPFPT